MTTWSDKKLKICRYLSYWLYVIFTIGIPIALVAWQFDIFKKPGPVQITGYGIIAIIIAFFIFWKHIKRAISEMEQGLAKTILHNLLMVVPFLLVWIAMTFMEDHIVRIRFIIFWTMIGLFVSAFFDLWHTLIIQELKKREK